jgi:hypothetical protein
MANLIDYSSIRSHLLVRIDIEYYRTTTSGSYSSQVLAFGDLPLAETVTFDGLTYTGLGTLVSLTSTSSELKPSSGELTITLTGIPNLSIATILNSKIKGCPVQIYRAMFSATTGLPLPLTQNPFGRFRGFVNNYSLTEEYNINNNTSSNTMLLICKNTFDVISNKTGGRLTNPTSQKKHFPLDLSMDRVPALQNTSFNFGAPK